MNSIIRYEEHELQRQEQLKNRSFPSLVSKSTRNDDDNDDDTEMYFPDDSRPQSPSLLDALMNDEGYENDEDYSDDDLTELSTPHQRLVTQVCLTKFICISTNQHLSCDEHNKIVTLLSIGSSPIHVTFVK